MKWRSEENLIKDLLIKVWPAFRKPTKMKCPEDSNSGEP